MNKLTGHIYVLLFPNGKRYVGQTIRLFRERWNRHLHDTGRGCTLPVNNAIRKYGKENITKEVFTIKCTQEYLDLLEKRTIGHYNTLSPFGLNLTEGGREGTRNEEAKQRLSASRRGRKHTEASKAKMSADRKGRPGRPKTEEEKARMRGRKRTEETKAKITLNNARRGKPAWNKGIPHTEEEKAKISAALKGRSKPWLLGRCLSKEVIDKRTATYKRNRLEKKRKQQQ